MPKRKLSDISIPFPGTTRNVIVTDEEIENKNEQAKNKNRENQNKRADKAFRNFLTEAGVTNTEYWLFEEQEFDKYLAKFWHGVRKTGISDVEDESTDIMKKNLKYSAGSMKSFQYALNRMLRKHGHLYDITDKKSVSFTQSNAAFETVMKELKAKGRAEVKSAPEITEEGTKKFIFP